MITHCSYLKQNTMIITNIIKTISTLSATLFTTAATTQLYLWCSCGNLICKRFSSIAIPITAKSTDSLLLDTFYIKLDASNYTQKFSNKLNQDISCTKAMLYERYQGYNSMNWLQFQSLSLKLLSYIHLILTPVGSWNIWNLRLPNLLGIICWNILHSSCGQHFTRHDGIHKRQSRSLLPWQWEW